MFPSFNKLYSSGHTAGWESRHNVINTWRVPPRSIESSECPQGGAPLYSHSLRRYSPRIKIQPGERSTISKYFSIMVESGFNVSKSIRIIPEDKAYKAQTLLLGVFIMLIRIGGGDFFLSLHNTKSLFSMYIEWCWSQVRLIGNTNPQMT